MTEEIVTVTVDDLRQLYEERAAIMEYDGGLTRAEAEQRAGEIIREMTND